jgi:ribosomal protein L10
MKKESLHQYIPELIDQYNIIFVLSIGNLSQPPLKRVA